MNRNELRAAAPIYMQPLRWLAALSIFGYHRVAYSIRGWGNLPHRRGAALVVANHQHEIESPIIVAELTLSSFEWRFPIFTVSSRRMWEPGFLAMRVPWLHFLRGVGLGPLFEAIGLQPIENELQSRPIVGFAHTFEARHGDLPVSAVFRERLIERFPSDVRTLSDLLSPAHFQLSRAWMKLSDLREPYRAEAIEITREDLEADIAHFERLAEAGATIFLTPEGFYTIDGKMLRLKGILPRLKPLMKTWLVGISYDPYLKRPMQILYRVSASVDGVPLDTQLKRTRPVTTSALLCTWLNTLDGAFSSDDAIAAVYERLSSLPRHAFVVPELRSNLPRAVQRVLDGMEKLQTVRRDGKNYALTSQRTHPKFERVENMIAFQANFHAQTLDGLKSYESGALESSGSNTRR